MGQEKNEAADQAHKGLLAAQGPLGGENLLELHEEDTVLTPLKAPMRRNRGRTFQVQKTREHLDPVGHGVSRQFAAIRASAGVGTGDYVRVVVPSSLASGLCVSGGTMLLLLLRGGGELFVA